MASSKQYPASSKAWRAKHHSVYLNKWVFMRFAAMCQDLGNSPATLLNECMINELEWYEKQEKPKKGAKNAD